MKKLFVLAGLALLLFSCDFFGDNITIYNNSSYTVVFVFFQGNDRSYTISPGNSDTYYAHNAKLQRYSSNPPRVSYRMKNDDEGEFYDTIPIELEFINTLDFPVSITEKNGYMDIDSITINAGEIIATGNIYTKNPVFIVSPTGKSNHVSSENKIFVTIY